MSVELLFPDPTLYPSAELYPSGGYSLLAERGWQQLRRFLTGGPGDALLLDLYEALLAGWEQIGHAAWGSELGPWYGVMDPAVCSDDALPFAAQIVLARLPGRKPGETQAAYATRARDAVLHPPERAVGTERAVIDAARPWLSGTKAVKVVDLVGDEWHFQVRVRSDEVINQAALAAAIDNPYILAAGQKPELVLVNPGSAWTIAEMEDAYATRTVADLEADFPTIAAFESNPGGL